ncbi:hypothetical protein BD410DRAFT_63135 [Rickenella mellea]|uniref:Uncharacterized protein n=1 Tax=Rickenella mellea TaxID=50990 RepID=A0A4Y7QAX9_9AGAM|nr:hypothetical protein BD410DRAFT_63135 [Rickenella mellea]
MQIYAEENLQKLCRRSQQRSITITKTRRQQRVIGFQGSVEEFSACPFRVGNTRQRRDLDLLGKFTDQCWSLGTVHNLAVLFLDGFRHVSSRLLAHQACWRRSMKFHPTLLFCEALISRSVDSSVGLMLSTSRCQVGLLMAVGFADVRNVQRPATFGSSKISLSCILGAAQGN